MKFGSFHGINNIVLQFMRIWPEVPVSTLIWLITYTDDVVGNFTYIVI